MFRIKNRKALAVMTALLLAGMTGCGESGGNKGVQSKNAVEGAMESQIAKEENKTAAPTETKTEVKTEVKTEAKTEVQATTAGKTEAATEAASGQSAEGDTEVTYISTPDASVDIDLTAMSSDMVYSTVYRMVLVDSEEYVGKKVKMKGLYTTAGSSKTDLTYHYVLIKDALACCQQGIEFQWEDGSHAADEYPELGSEVEVIGVFETYVEDEDPDYVYTRLKDASMTVLKGPDVSSQNVQQ